MDYFFIQNPSNPSFQGIFGHYPKNDIFPQNPAQAGFHP